MAAHGRSVPREGPPPGRGHRRGRRGRPLRRRAGRSVDGRGGVRQRGRGPGVRAAGVVRSRAHRPRRLGQRRPRPPRPPRQPNDLSRLAVRRSGRGRSPDVGPPGAAADADRTPGIDDVDGAVTLRHDDDAGPGELGGEVADERDERPPRRAAGGPGGVARTDRGLRPARPGAVSAPSPPVASAGRPRSPAPTTARPVRRARPWRPGRVPAPPARPRRRRSAVPRRRPGGRPSGRRRAPGGTSEGSPDRSPATVDRRRRRDVRRRR